MTSRHFWSVLCVVLLSVLPTVAQTQAGISGVIRDPSGAVIPGVTITVTNPATNSARSVISNEAGVYNLPGLQPGKYNIKVELPGSARSRRMTWSCRSSSRRASTSFCRSES